MKKVIVITIIGSLSFLFSYSQKQVNNWFFGVNAGISFNSGAPVVIPGGQTSTNEGSAVVSDTSGNLLFYTDGNYVWNRQHQQMPNGFGLFGGINSSTQAAVIIPDPGSDSLYYIFTIDEWSGTNGFNYSIVDMSLDSGKGDVTLKNSFLLNNAVEKITAVYHANNHDVWIMVHLWGSNSFYAYLLNNSGLGNPVISNAGTVHQLSPGQNSVGQMKFNSCGNKLAVAIGYQNTVDVLDFDNITGVVSNPVTINFPDHVYGVEFSPDNSKLYTSCYDPAATLSQFDLLAANLASSKVDLSNTPDIYGLQLGPDNKIYVVKGQSQFLGVINFPDLQGTLCNYVDIGFDTDPNFNGAHAALGLPGFIQSYFHPDFPNVQCNVPVAGLQSSDTVLCEKNCVDFTDLSQGIVTNWLWLFPGATPSSDTSQHPVNICYNNYGTYDIALIVTNNAGTDTLFLPGFIKVLQSPPIPSVSSYGDTLIASSAFAYQWYFGSNVIPGAVQQIFIATQPGNYFVTISDSNGCQSTSGIILVSNVPGYQNSTCLTSRLWYDNHILSIEMKGCEKNNITIQIYNTMGEEIFRSRNKHFSNTIAKEFIPVALLPGFYIISFASEDMKWSKKFLVLND